MTETARLSAPPALGAVLVEQVRTVALAAWREAAAVTALLAVAAVVAISIRMGASEEFEGQPGGMPFFTLVGFLCPWVFWKGEKLFDNAYVWTLPVDRARHALAKALAGWGWLMLSIAGFLGWLVAITLLSGGTVGAEQTRLMLPASATGAPVSRADLAVVPWTTPWAWIVPFATGTIAYLFGTAFRLGLKHPFRWVVGLLASFFLLLILGEEGVAGGRIEALTNAVILGPYGANWALTGGVGLSDELTTADGRTVVVWRDFQTAGRWIAAATLWTLAGAIALGAAVHRHRER